MSLLPFACWYINTTKKSLADPSRDSVRVTTPARGNRYAAATSTSSRTPAVRPCRITSAHVAVSAATFYSPTATGWASRTYARDHAESACYGSRRSACSVNGDSAAAGYGLDVSNPARQRASTRAANPLRIHAASNALHASARYVSSRRFHRRSARSTISIPNYQHTRPSVHGHRIASSRPQSPRFLFARHAEGR